MLDLTTRLHTRLLRRPFLQVSDRSPLSATLISCEAYSDSKTRGEGQITNGPAVDVLRKACGVIESSCDALGSGLTWRQQKIVEQVPRMLAAPLTYLLRTKSNNKKKRE